MKEKTITIKTNGIAQRQYSTLLLELNIMKQQWRSYGVHLTISAPGLKKIIALGTSNGSDNTKRRNV
tara:strand:+ start:233 stop:433 length:201 start_codon:yes stop_codon:yes gene_type:complete